MPTSLYMYEFRYYDALRRKWMRARYRSEAPEIRCRYGEYELVGRPEIRVVPDNSQLRQPTFPPRG